jgi:hypothetical protein
VSRKETIRPGLEIDFDLLDSDLLRCYMRVGIHWADIPNPRLVWMEFIDKEDWTEDKPVEPRVMTRTLDNEHELAEGRRMIRLQNYKSYACLAELAKRLPEPGEFVIRRPPSLGYLSYVRSVNDAALPPGLGDPDLADIELPDSALAVTLDIAEARRFSHADAVRLTIRIMEAQGYDVPDDHGEYWEPVRADVAEELHARAIRRPRFSQALHAVVDDISREP